MIITLSDRNNLWARMLSCVVIIQFLCLDLSWAGVNKQYLAARSRIQLFFSKNNVELSTPQEMALSMAMGQLQKSILEYKRLDITGEIQQINNTLSTVNITITTSNLEFDQESKIPYIAITVNGNKNSFRVYFLKEDERKVNERLMIKEKDLRHFDCPGLEGIWFVEKLRIKDLGHQAFMAGEEKLVFSKDKHSFLGEVKAVIREAFRTTGKVLIYYSDGNRLFGETNRGEELWVGIGTRSILSGTQFLNMWEIAVDGYIQKLLISILRNHPSLRLAFIEGLNLLSFKSLDLYQVARVSERRNQIYLPLNLLYLLYLSSHPDWVMEYIVTYEAIRKESEENLRASVNAIREKTRERLDGGALDKEKAFLEIAQLSAVIEYISKEIEKHNGEDLILSLDEDGILKGRRTGRVEAILEIDIKQKFGVELGDQTLTYWDILLERLKGDKDSNNEIITKGESKEGISKLLIQTLLRRELVKVEQSKSEDARTYGPLSDINLARFGEFVKPDKEGKKTISIGSTCLLNIREGKDSKYTYAQNATGIQYILKAIKDGYNVEVINEQKKLITEEHMELILKQIFGTPLQVINLETYENRQKGDELLLLSEDSRELRKERKGVTTIIGSRGTSFNVLLTFGLYKLAKSENSEIKKMLMALGYTNEQTDEIIRSSGVIILPPIVSFAHIINTIAEFTRTIDVSA